MSSAVVLADRKRAAATRFAAEGVPHRRIEAWHYSDLRAALPALLKPASSWTGAVVREGALADPFAGIDADTLLITNGRYRPELTPASGSDRLEIVDLASRDTPQWALTALGTTRGPDEAPMADLALSEMTSGLAIRVARGKAIAKPLHLAFVHHAIEAETRNIRIVVVLEAGASLTLLESHAGHGEASMTNRALELQIARNAVLTHFTIAENAARDVHVATTFAKIETNATYDLAIAAGQGAFARHEVQAVLAGEPAHIRITGLTLLGGAQHADITAVIDHAMPNGRSDLIFKNVLAGKSRGVAQGRILVRPGANGTDSKQLTRALLLSRTAEADAKPELEIHADDVVCGHGAAIGQLDADALFYLRARGIPEGEARAMLTEAFLEEGLARLPASPAAEAMRSFVLDRLRGLEVAP